MDGSAAGATGALAPALQLHSNNINWILGLYEYENPR
jgi:hypothetical protein